MDMKGDFTVETGIIRLEMTALVACKHHGGGYRGRKGT